ncbi:MAG TPA: TonB family protein [Vicinamibacterales bacterium]|jgi:TonB family protein|nr:TonB family protein [Vicinamibacterales bacterium]
MRAAIAPFHDVFSAAEIAQAAGVGADDVGAAIADGQVVAFRGFVAAPDAVALVRRLAAGRGAGSADRAPVSTLPPGARAHGGGFAASAIAHAAFAAFLMFGAARGLFEPAPPPDVPPPHPARLVYLVAPGPSGGGGGGGMHMPAPPPPPKRAAAAPRPRVQTPVRAIRVPPRRPPPIRPPIRPPVRPVQSYRVPPRPVPPPPPTPPLTVQAPVAPAASNRVDAPGVPTPRPAPPSAGPGTGTGAGSGSGAGMGSGTGPGIGPGTGGGTGGGAYAPGSGIAAPMLVREVRPAYTEEGRRLGLQGDVVLQVTVRRDGSVGDIRVVRGLGAGLEERAVDAVRQWRFTPATRQGAPVDVSVQISVEFSLR